MAEQRKVSDEDYAKIVDLADTLGACLADQDRYDITLLALSLLTAKVITIAEGKFHENYLDPVLGNIRLMRADMIDDREGKQVRKN